MESSKDILSQINKDYLTCQICMDVYQDPKVLSCQHSFCLKCLEACDKTEHNSYILCPLCRQRTILGLQGVSGLKTNFVLSNIANMMKSWRDSQSIGLDTTDSEGEHEMCQTCPGTEPTMATYQCITCLDHLCADCAAFHTRTKMTNDHQVVSIQDIESGKYKTEIKTQQLNRCQQHKALNLDHYCYKCDALVCRDCIIEAHRSHKLSTTNETVTDLKKQVTSIEEEISEGINATEKCLKDLSKLEVDEIEQLQKIHNDIENLAQEFISKIEKEKEKMISEVENLQVNKLHHLKTSRDQLELQLNCMQDCTRLTHCVLKDGTPVEIISMRKKLTNTLTQLKETAVRAEDQLQDHLKQLTHLQYERGNIEESTQLGLGKLEKIQTSSQKIELNIFKKEELVRKSDQLEVEKQSKKSVSFCEPDNKEMITNEELYVDLPVVDTDADSCFTFNASADINTPSTSKPFENEPKPEPIKAANKPVAAPRRTKSNASTMKPKPLVAVKPQKSSQTNNKKLNNNATFLPPTLPPKPALYENIEKIQLTAMIKPQPRRAAPEPPPPSPTTTENMKKSSSCDDLQKKAHRNDDVHFSTIERAARRNKKMPAPRPPSLTMTLSLKAHFLREFGVRGKGHGEFVGTPNGVAILNDKIYVLDSDGKHIVSFDKDGYFSDSFKVILPNQAKLKATNMCASIDQKHIYILYRTMVTLWTLDGTIILLFGHKDIQDAHGIAVSKTGNVVVSDQSKHEVSVFDKNGSKIFKFGGYGDKDYQFKNPRYVCCTNNEEIIVSDHHNHCIKVFDRKGRFTFKFGWNGNIEDQLKYPESIWCIKPNNKTQNEVILVADEGHKRILAFKANGQFICNVLEPFDDQGLKSPQLMTESNGKLVVLQTNIIQARLYDLKTLTGIEKL